MPSSSCCYILVVDDIPDNLFLLQAVLEAEGYAVDSADCGAAALAKIQSCPPDLVLLDVMMPDMSGFEVTRRIRQDAQNAALPIVLITAYDSVNIEQGLTLGADDFIRKPIDFEQLLERVRKFCPQ